MRIGVFSTEGRGSVPSGVLEASDTVGSVRWLDGAAGFLGESDLGVAVLVAPDLGTTRAAMVLQVLRSGPEGPPVLLVTDLGDANLAGLGGVPLAGLFGLDVTAARLARALGERSHGSAPLSELADLVRGRTDWPEELRTLVVIGLLRTPPFTRVGSLARTLRVDRTTVAHWWRATHDGPASLKTLLRLLMVRHGLVTVAGSRQTSWTACAQELGVGKATLARAGEELLGKPLNELRASDLARCDALLRSLLEDDAAA